MTYLENVAYALQKNAYSVTFGGNVLCMSVKSIWSNLSFKAIVSFIISCLGGLSIGESGGIKIPYCYCIAISLFRSIHICFMYLADP